MPEKKLRMADTIQAVNFNLPHGLNSDNCEKQLQQRNHSDRHSADTEKKDREVVQSAINHFRCGPNSPKRYEASSAILCHP